MLPYKRNSSDRADSGLGLRHLDCWNCGFESLSGRLCSSLVFVVKVAVSVKTSYQVCVCVSNGVLSTKLKNEAALCRVWLFYRKNKQKTGMHELHQCSKRRYLGYDTVSSGTYLPNTVIHHRLGVGKR